MRKQIYEDPNSLIFIQSRAEANFATIDEYAQMMENGVAFDPVEAVQDGETGQIFVWDGYHRGEAARRAGRQLAVRVQPGTRSDAEWFSFAANQKHGLRRTTQDKQRVVRNALLHPNGAGLSDREIARHCGVDHKTVGRIRKELEVSGEIPQIEKRTVRRGRKTYTQDTSKIGATTASVVELEIREEKGGEYDCPRCHREKVVHTNGRIWCLNCDAKWGTAGEFIKERDAAEELSPDSYPDTARQKVGMKETEKNLGEERRSAIEVEEMRVQELRISIVQRVLTLVQRIPAEQLEDFDAWLDEMENDILPEFGKSQVQNLK
jgi:ribosomal protein L37AE/L43A